MASDIRDMKEYKSSTEAENARRNGFPDNTYWYSAENKDEERSRLFVSHCEALKNDSARREAANVRHARLYENVEINSLTGTDYATATVRQAILGSGIVTLNVVAAAEDTLAAKIAKNKPRPAFLTSAASWKEQMKARRLDKWSRGYFYETKVYEKAKSVFYDAMTFGTGFLYIFKDPDDNRLNCERVIPSEIFCDDADGKYGEPRQLIRRKIYPREVLVDMFPEYADQIRASKPPADEQISNQVKYPMVEVWEGWHLPSSKGAKDGKHIIAIKNCELFCEDWKIDRFPFVTRRFKRRTVGFWGKGVAETLVGIQVELNRLIWSVSKQLRRRGRGRIYIEYGSKVNPNHITNDIGDIVYYRGQPPVVDNQNSVAPEEFQQIDRLYQRAFQEVGVSELSAASKKPSGLDAAVAMREFSEIESERFALVHQDHEQFFLDFCETSIELITKQFGWSGYKVKMPSRRNAIEVDWADIDLKPESYIMQMFPVSSLPQTPAAKLQRVQELMQGGFIDQTIAKRLLDFPDVDAEMHLGNAALDDADSVISAILDEETPKLMPLEPYQNIDLIIERAIASYLYARHFPDIEQERLTMLRTLIDTATAMKAALVAPPPAPPGPVPSPAGPGAGAVSGPPINNTNTVNIPQPPAVPPVIAQ